MGHGKNELKRIMKKIVCFCAVAFAIVMPAGVYASNVSLLGNPPQQGTTTVHESCYTHGVEYERGKSGVSVTRPNYVDVNVNVTRSNGGESHSKDTRTDWEGSSSTRSSTTTHSTYATTQDNVEIRCYPRDQK